MRANLQDKPALVIIGLAPEDLVLLRNVLQDYLVANRYRLVREPAESKMAWRLFLTVDDALGGKKRKR